MFTAFSLKALLIITCITIGFAGFTKCDAQSIVGKWKVISIKMFFNAQGRAPVEHATPPNEIYQFEFKPDKTYIVTDVTGVQTGTWSVSGNQLTMKAPEEEGRGRTSTFSITGNKMIRMEIAPPPYNKVQSKTEFTSTRM